MTKLTTSLLSLALLTSITACADDGTASASFGDNDKAIPIIRDFADVVIVPTYELLDKRANALATAVETLKTTTNDINLTAAQNAWAATRQPWEQSEGFIFGPVDANGFDPALDSWPVNRTDLEAVLASSDPLSETFVGNLETTSQGFHTIEYLLFGVDSTKIAADLSQRELEYLSAAIGLMTSATDSLARSWTTGINGSDAYASIFKTAGEANNRVYPSLEAAGQEIVNGMIGILDEVGTGKIADPFDSQDTTLVESQFSFNSLKDFSDNIKSVQNAYLGKNAVGGSGVGFSQFIADLDPALDIRLQTEIQAAIDALAAIPEPFRDSVLDSAQADIIKAAQSAIATAQTTMENDILPLVTN